MTNYEWLVERYLLAYFLKAIYNNDIRTIEEICVKRFNPPNPIESYGYILELTEWLGAEHIDKEFVVSYDDVRDIIQDTIYTADENQVTDKFELSTKILNKLDKLDKTPIEIKNEDEENKDDKL